MKAFKFNHSRKARIIVGAEPANTLSRSSYHFCYTLRLIVRTLWDDELRNPVSEFRNQDSQRVVFQRAFRVLR